jgi:undecaprenyl-diphosphatase
LQKRRQPLLAVLLGAIFILVFGLVHAGSTMTFDESLFHALNDPASNSFVGISAIFLTEFGSETVLALVGVAYYFLAKSDRKEVLLGIFLTIALSDFVLALLKGAYYRPRPYLVLLNANLPAGLDSGSSFPSGHATRAFAAMAFLAIRRGRRYAPFLLVALGVAISRVVIGVHFPTDVVAGALLGATIAIVSLLFLERTVYPRLKSPNPMTP